MNENNFAEELVETARKRNMVLENSLAMENLINSMLAGILSIRPAGSKSLGTSSSALPFNTKVNLLIDLGALKPEHQSKFQLFMEIRNKFMHLISVQSFKNCYDLLEGRKNSLNKLYPPKAVNENDYEIQYEKLFQDVFEIGFSIREHVRDNLIKAGTNQSIKVVYDLLFDQIPKKVNDLESEIEKVSLNREKLKLIVEEIKKLVSIAGQFKIDDTKIDG